MTETRTQQSGRLEDVAPLDLLQSLGIYRRPGHVSFLHPHGRSQLWFEAGQIVDARSGALQGVAAVHRIVTHDRGEFRVEITAEPRSPAFEAGAGLVFEAARRLDEGQRLRARLHPGDAVLCRSASSSNGRAPTEAHARVVAQFEEGATLDEVLERSTLGELETLEWVAELIDAGQIEPTGAMRSPMPSDALPVASPWPPGLESSQPFVPSPAYASEEGFDDAVPPRRRGWIHASAGAAVACLVTLGVLAILSSRTDAPAPEETALAVAGSPTAVTDPSAPVVQLHELVSHDRADVPDAPAPTLTRGAERELDRETDATGSTASRQSASVRARPKLASSGPTTARAEPPAKAEDPGKVLAEARRAYAAGKGATAYRLASQSQRLRPSDQAAELVALAACQMQRPDTALEALRAVPLLRRGHVRSTCKRSHGVRLKLGLGR